MALSNRSKALCPGYLIASPKLDGTPFERAVVAIVHHDEEGAVGFVLNKPLEIDFGTLIQSVNDELARQVVPASFAVPVYFGGPVRIEQLWLIFAQTRMEQAIGPALAPGSAAEPRVSYLERLAQTIDEHSTVPFAPGWYLSACGDIIEAHALGHAPGAYRPFIGYSGWGPGQLEGEIDDGSWLLLDFDPEFFFRPHHLHQWNEALGRLGVNPTAFLMMARAGMA